jgi:hypothetical protein
MVDDSVALGELCRSFEAGLADVDGSLAARSVAETEADLGHRVAALAKALGWRTGLEFRLRPIDYPRAGTFPRRLHQHTGRMRLNGTHAAEFWFNSNALDSGSFSLLLERLPVFLWLFGAVLERRPDMAADVACFPGDACFWNAVASSANHPDACLVPDPVYFKTGGYAEFRTAMETQVPRWESRRGVVLWRGSTSGIKRYWPPSAPDDVRWLPRLELCARAQSGALAEYCDVGVVNLVQIPDTKRPAVEAALAGLRRSPVEKAVCAQVKAVFDIDGNGNAWSGLYCSFLTGACVIKIASEHGFRQWYYERLKPWVHYVPVRADFSDLEENVRLVMTDDELARTIGQAGRDFVNSMDFAGELSAAVDRLISWAGIQQRADRSRFAT